MRFKYVISNYVVHNTSSEGLSEYNLNLILKFPWQKEWRNEENIGLFIWICKR